MIQESLNDMDERIEIERRQSLMNKDKKISKTESRFKFKLKSLTKTPRVASNSSAMDKARAFFRSLDRKHLGNNNEQSSSSSPCQGIMNTPPHSSSSIINDSPTNDSVFNSSIVGIIPNPRDMIIHRVIHNNQDEDKLRSSYFHQKYKQLLKPSLLAPKQYYNEILNKRNQNYLSSIGRRDSRPLFPGTALNSSFNYSTRTGPQPHHSTNIIEAPFYHPIPTSLYNHRPLVCRQIEPSFLTPSSFTEPYHPLVSSPPSPSPSSMSRWTHSVRRLNTEYRLTINALQQAKECLEQIYTNSTDPITKYANLVARGINNLSNDEDNPILISRECPSLSLSPTKTSIKQNTKIPSITFSKPKLVRPIEIDTFIPSSSTLDPILSITEKNENTQDSISNIIKKFNNLNKSPLIKKSSSFKSTNNVTTTIPTYLVPSINLSENKSSLPPPFSLSSVPEYSINIENRLQEETIYTVDTFYKSVNDKGNDLPSNSQHVVVLQENTTEEQFNLAYKNQNQDSKVCHASPSLNKNHDLIDSSLNDTKTIISDGHHNEDDETINDVITINSLLSSSISQCLINSESSSSTNSFASTVLPVSKANSTSSTSSITIDNFAKNNNKSISHIPKSTSRLKQPSKIVSPSSKLKSPASANTKIIKPTIANGATASIKKSNSSVNKTAPQQPLSIGKKQQLIKGTDTNESLNSTGKNKLVDFIQLEPASLVDTNRVKLMVNQLNAAVSSPSRPSAPSSIANKRTAPSTLSRRPVSIQPSASNSKNTTQQKSSVIRSTSNIKENSLH